MTVAVDAVAEAVRTDTTSPFTFAHTGRLDVLGGVQGVIVACIHGTSSTDHVSAVSYGGVALSRAKRNVDTATEPGAAELWFVGAGLSGKGGLQTVSITCGATTDDFHFVVITLTGDTDLVVVDSDGVDNDVANPSVTLQYGGKTCMSFAALYAGGAAPSSFTPNANCTTVHDHDLGAFYSEVIRQTTAGSSDFAIGGTSGTDDVAFAAIAVGELNAYAYTGAGGAAGAGAAVVSHDKVYPTSGGVSAAGSAVVQFSREFAYVGAGGLDTDGAAPVVHDKLYAGTGGAQVAGAGDVSHDKVVVAVGGLQTSGAAAIAHGKVYEPAGGFVAGGHGEHVFESGGGEPVNYEYVASGGKTLGGSAPHEYHGYAAASVVTTTPGIFRRRRVLGRVRKEMLAAGGIRSGGSAGVEVVLGARAQPAEPRGEEAVLGLPPAPPLVLPEPDYAGAARVLESRMDLARARRRRVKRADARLLGMAS